MNYYEMEKIKYLENIEAVTLEILGELKEIKGMLKKQEEDCVYALEDNVKEALTQHCEELAESDIEMEVPEEDGESTECTKGTYTDAEMELMLMAKFVGVELGDEKPNFCELWGDVLSVTLEKMNRLARDTWGATLPEEEEKEPEIAPLSFLTEEDEEHINKMQQELLETVGIPKKFLHPSPQSGFNITTTTSEKTEYICPKCGEHLYRESKTLLPNPPKKQYTCLNCHYVEYQYM